MSFLPQFFWQIHFKDTFTHRPKHSLPGGGDLPDPAAVGLQVRKTGDRVRGFRSGKLIGIGLLPPLRNVDGVRLNAGREPRLQPDAAYRGFHFRQVPVGQTVLPGGSGVNLDPRFRGQASKTGKVAVLPVQVGEQVGAGAEQQGIVGFPGGLS